MVVASQLQRELENERNLKSSAEKTKQETEMQLKKERSAKNSIEGSLEKLRVELDR